MNELFFTVDEANALLPTLKPLVGRLMLLRERVAELTKEVEHKLEDTYLDLGGANLSQLAVDFDEIDKLINKIQGHGCTLRSLNLGMLNFLSHRDGKEIYLSWQYGEAEIAYYQEVSGRENGRFPL